MRADRAPARSRILMLHRVLDGTAAAFGLPTSYRMRGTAVTVAELERILDEAEPIVSLEAVERASGRGDDPPVGSVLTFDDGYREHLDIVAPLLAARGLTGTFYVATGLHGEGSAVALVDAWYWLLDHAERGAGLVPLPDGGVFQGRLDTADGKAMWVAGPPKAALLAAAPIHQRRMLDALAYSSGAALPGDLAAQLYLKPVEWRSLVCLGMRVGAHSISHPRLTQVCDDALNQEVGESVRTIAEICAPVAFAYPDGAWDQRVVASVRAAGVSSAVTCEQGGVMADGDILKLPRYFAGATCFSGR